MAVKNAMPTVLDNDTDDTYREGYQRRVDMSATSVQSQFPSSHVVRILKGGRAVRVQRTTQNRKDTPNPGRIGRRINIVVIPQLNQTYDLAPSGS